MGWECSRAEPLGRGGLEFPACAVCGSTRRRVVADAAEMRQNACFLRRFFAGRSTPGTPAAMLADKADFTQGYATNVVECTDCGLLYRCPRPPGAAVVAGYAHDHYGREKLDALFAAERPFYGKKVGALARRLRPGSRILEVGSFVGAFLDASRAAGWDATGVDVGAEVVGYARGRGLPVLQGQIHEVDLAPSTFDALFIWNCLDQIPDPWPVLRRARELLRPGGLLVARVPNGNCFRAATHLLHATRSEALGRLVQRLLAVNNLLTFPYLYGYTAGTLRRVIGECSLSPRGLVSDVLVDLSDRYTCAWAALEERRLKAVARFLANLTFLASAGRLSYAPWIEAFAVKPPP